MTNPDPDPIDALPGGGPSTFNISLPLILLPILLLLLLLLLPLIPLGVFAMDAR